MQDSSMSSTFESLSKRRWKRLPNTVDEVDFFGSATNQASRVHLDLTGFAAGFRVMQVTILDS